MEAPVPPTIVVVEPDLQVQRLLIRLLHTVTTCTILPVTSALSALEAIATAQTALLLVDDDIPEMTDGALVQQLRRRAPEVAVCVLTHQGDSMRAHVALAAGAMGYVQKPFMLAELAALVRSVVGTTWMKRKIADDH